MSFFRFEVIYQSTKSRARVGRIHTPHGIIDTPTFVPVGTNGTLKALDPVATTDLGVQLMFCNTYHLMLQPGAAVVQQAGGLHKFMNRTAPIITDSGGFQVFSLAYGTVKDELKSRGQKKYDNSIISMNEEGVLFRSYRDGSPVLLTPETSVAAQKQLGADIIIPFDELPPYHIDPTALKKSLDRTHRWEKRSLEAHIHNRADQAMYAVIHGGIDQAMRAESCNFLTNLPFDGYAIGGSIGKNRQEMLELLAFVMPRLPEEKPNHLLGIGDIASLLPSIQLGVDSFDSSHPTRCARHGLLFTAQGMQRIMQSSNKNNPNPAEEGCTCYTCKNYSMAYIQHLFKAHEMAGFTLATIHNVAFMTRLMAQYRSMILAGLL